MKLIKIIYFLSLFLFTAGCNDSTDKKIPSENETHLPEVIQEDNEELDTKNTSWTAEQAAYHQNILKTKLIVNQTKGQYAGGDLTGDWKSRGPHNMPGAFKIADALDDTDTIYAVTHNHYTTEYGAKSYIFKGTVYNSASGTTGDDFERLTGHWPNQYKNLMVIRVNNQVRLIAHIENGPIYFSDDEGLTWTESTGLPTSIMSSAINRQDGNKVYVTDGTSLFVSSNSGESFTSLQNFGSQNDMAVYSPRHTVQPGADKVYMVRDGDFYTLNAAGTNFDLNGTYFGSHGNSSLSIAGDDNKLYVTEWSRYWVSSDNGVTWTQKYPSGNWYGDTSGEMSAGKYLAACPTNSDIIIGGYAIPIFSSDGLNTVQTDHAGWGGYQNGTNLPASDYYNRIRFNYHPDFQTSYFFYNSNDELYSLRCTDGGLFMSYKEWFDLPINGNYNNSNYTNAHYINITTLNTVCPLIYRHNMFTGIQDPNQIYYSTQDQGSGSLIGSGITTSGDLLDFYQSIGGDGPPMDSYDGEHVWKWSRQGTEVWAPTTIYNGSTPKTIGAMSNNINSLNSVTFVQNTNVGWVQIHIDHDEPDKRMWLMGRDLFRAENNNGNMSGTTTDLDNHLIAALAQGWTNPDVLHMLQGGEVYTSSDRGLTFALPITTPFSTPGTSNKSIGSGVVLPTDDNFIVFCGPSLNNVGSILSLDGGITWTDITGDFPAGEFAQTGDMVATPNGQFIFAATDVGPYVFVVSEMEWHAIGGIDVPFFNGMDVDYIESIQTVRFSSWGSGIWDFNITNLIFANVENNTQQDIEFITVNTLETTVTIPKNGNYTFKIFNLTGQVLFEHQANFDKGVNSIHYDLSAIANQVCLVVIEGEDSKIVKKVVL
jgi:hypothetical protein